MSITNIVVWLIIGMVAGTVAGRLMTFSKQGYGFWANIGVGMVGAVVGGVLFWVFRIDLGLGEIKISAEDVVSAIVGSLICVIIWRLLSFARSPSK